MRIRTSNDLFDRIASDQAWRKKEVAIFATQVSESRGAIRAALLRPAVALLYAHWEGFIKNTIHYYLIFLSEQNTPLDGLRDEIVARCMRARIGAAASSKRITPHIDVVRQFRTDRADPARIPILKSDVDTASNLNFTVLSDLLNSVGCGTSAYDSFEGIIDEHLVGSRNKIAHGESFYVEMEQWEELKREIFELMDLIAFQIVEAAEQRDYLATS